MKFKFSYQQLLEHRKRLEEIAQKEYLLAQKEVDDAEVELEKMYQQIDDSRQRAGFLQAKGGDQAASLVFIDDFINKHKIRIETQRKKIRERKSIAEEKQQALVNAAKEYKILDKLREKKVIDFKHVEKKRELKFVDDLVTMRYKRGENL